MTYGTLIQRRPSPAPNTSGTVAAGPGRHASQGGSDTTPLFLRANAPDSAEPEATSASGPPVLFGLDTGSNTTYLSVVHPGRGLLDVALYLYGVPALAEALKEKNGLLPDFLAAGTVLRLTGDNLTETASRDLRTTLENGTILRSEGIPDSSTGQMEMYRFSAVGRTYVLTRTQLDGMLNGLSTYLIRKANYVKGLSEGHQETHDNHLKNTNSFVRGISNWRGGTVDPPVYMWDSAINIADRVKTYLRESQLTPDRITRASRMLQVAANAYADAKMTWSRYIEATIAGAGGVITALEFTRDIGFGIAIGIGAIVAFPVAAKAAATLLGTGKAASGAIAATVVVGGGATTRGVVQAGSDITGQAFTGAPIDWGRVADEYAAGYRSGAVDAGASLIGWGVGGKVLQGMGRYSGEFATTGQRAFSQALAYGTGGSAAGSLAGGGKAALEGRSAEEVWQHTQQGALWGGGLGIAGGVLSPLAGKIFPFQYGPGARSFRVTPHRGGRIFGGEEQGLIAAVDGVVHGRMSPSRAMQRVRELFNPALKWQRLAARPDLPVEEFIAPKPGDVILMGTYGSGTIRVMTTEGVKTVQIENLFWNQHYVRGPMLGARTLGWQENVVSNEARRLCRQTGSMERILNEEMPYLMKAKHIYFFTTRDMSLHKITWAEFEIIMDNLHLLRKTTLIPLD